MSIVKLMTKQVEHCTPETDLAAAAMIMWRADCGAVAVVEPGTGRLVGVVTDRDICMAAATRHRAICHIPVDDVMTRAMVTCRPSDSAPTVLTRMAEHQIRRVPVVDDEGRPVGVVSIADLIRASASPGSGHGAPVAASDVLSALRAICRPPGTSEASLGSRTSARRRTSARVTAGARSSG